MKNRKHRVILVVLTGILFVPFLTMCSSNKEVTELTYFCGLADSRLAAMQTLVEDFNTTHEGEIEITFTSSSDFESVMRTRMGSNDMPDLFETHGWSTRRYAEYCYDLSGESWVSNIDPGMLSITTTKDGKLCTMPIDIGQEGLIFNNTILETYGINVDELDTWDQFVEALRTIKEESNGETIPFFSTNPDGGLLVLVIMELMSANSRDNPEDLLEGGTNFDWSQVTAAYTALRQLVDEELLNEDYLTAVPPDLVPAFGAETIAFANLSSYGVAAKEMNPDLDWGYMPVPYVEGVGTEKVLMASEGNTLAVWAESEGLEAALMFLEYVAEDDHLITFCSGSGTQPASTTITDFDLGASTYWYRHWLENDVAAVPLFDRGYLPNGTFDAIIQSCSKLLLGTVDAEGATQMLRDAYYDLYTE